MERIDLTCFRSQGRFGAAASKPKPKMNLYLICQFTGYFLGFFRVYSVRRYVHCDNDYVGGRPPIPPPPPPTFTFDGSKGVPLNGEPSASQAFSSMSYVF